MRDFAPMTGLEAETSSLLRELLKARQGFPQD